MPGSQEEPAGKLYSLAYYTEQICCGTEGKQDAEIGRQGTIDLQGATLSLLNLGTAAGDSVAAEPLRWCFQINLGSKDAKTFKVRHALPRTRCRYAAACPTLAVLSGWI
eukprot:SAG11_NODE_4641_length_1824_cov_1.761739_3_plen_109_part_00